MINTLVSLDADLASSIAFRYACRLMEFIDMRLQPIHVEEVDKEGYPPGSGWVRSTWENGLLETAREEISQLINAEKSTCPQLDAALMRIGGHEDELLKEIEERSYDLMVEGVLSSFDAQLFNQKVRSKLYKYAPCPIILVKNLVHVDRVALLMESAQDVDPVVSTFLKLFTPSRLTVDLIYFTFLSAGQPASKRKLDEVAEADGGDAHRVINQAATLLAEKDWKPGDCWFIQDRPKRIGEMLGDYSLVGASLPRSTGRKNLAIDLLGRVPSATLLCRK